MRNTSEGVPGLTQHPIITASSICTQPLAWVRKQRRLFDAMCAAAQVYLDKYTRDDGALIWARIWPDTRDSEHYTYFYFLCLADPTYERNVARARRFADLYADPRYSNYDPLHKLIRAPHSGSGGPRWGFFDSRACLWSYDPWMAPYGLPFDDVPGVSRLEGQCPSLAGAQLGDDRSVGAAHAERTAANLQRRLLIAPLRYFDAQRRRSGLPLDVAALVERSETARVVVQFVNLSASMLREVIVQAGTFGEHCWDSVAYDVCAGAADRIPVNASQLRVVLPLSSEIRLHLTVTRNANTPTYRVA